MTLFQAFGQFAGQAAVGFPALTYLSSTSFGAVATVSTNNVFTSDFTNYLIMYRIAGTTSINVYMRLRASGTDNSTANSYVQQVYDAQATSYSSGRFTGAQWPRLLRINSGDPTGGYAHIYNPAVASPTLMSSKSSDSFGGCALLDTGGTHNQSVAYDGFTLFPDSGTISGNFRVYGLSDR